MKNEETKKRNYQSLEIKRQAVEAYEQGTIPVRDLLEQYNIYHSTLWRWRKQLKSVKPAIQSKPRHPQELKLRIVKQIVMGAFTVKTASAHFAISISTLARWCSKYSSQISGSTDPMAKKRANESSPESERIRQLERALEDANLKILGLETIINVAEKDLKIDIRKKPGTKQSKS